MPNRPASFVSCPHCNLALTYVGTKQFHEGTRFWDFMGGIWELFKNRESFDLYVCERCGRVEFFIDGIGEEMRGEQDQPAVADLKQDGGVELLNQAANLDREGEWDQALAIYERVLQEPRYQQHHDYARSCIELIREKKSMSEGAT